MLFGLAGLLAGLLLALLIAWVRSKQQRLQMELAKQAVGRIIEEAKKDAIGIKKDAEI